MIGKGILIFLLASSRLVLSLVIPGRTGWRKTRTYSSVQPLLSAATSVEQDEVIETDFVVCGGGPAGLLSAIMLAQKFPNEKIQVYDRLSPPPKPTDEDAWSDVARFYLIGLGSRGQKALKSFGVLDEVVKASVAVLGRRDWAPDSEEGNEQLFTERKVQTIVLPRDKLVGVLHQHVLDNYSDRIELNHGYEIQPVNFGVGAGDERVVLRASQCSPTVSNISASEEKTASEQQEEVLCDTLNSKLVSSKLLVAADGTVRTIANAIQASDEEKFQSMNPVQRLFAGSPFKVRRYHDDNKRIYKTIPIKFPSDWRTDINYSARSKEQRIVFDALPANKDGEYCAVMLIRESDSLAKADSDPAELRSALEEYLPQFSGMIDDAVLKTVAKKPPSYLPAFRYIGPRLNEGDKTIILGDCAHTVKPYFGLGANSALEDVRLFSDIIDGSENLGKAVHRFSETRAIESKKLVTISRELDRPGALGFVTFILPIILDAIFHKSFPSVFSPNVITMLQRDDLTFTQVARRKRLDRLGQVSLLFGGGYGLVKAFKFILVSAAKALGRRASTVAAGLFAAAVGLSLLKKLLPFLVPGLAPADVMTRTSGQGKA